MINELFYETLRKNSSLFNQNQIDFIGINIDSNGIIECKIYPTPEETVISTELSPFEKSIFDKNMLRCMCHAYSVNGIRSYIALKNKGQDNVLWLINSIKKENPFIDVNELINLSSIRVNDDPYLCYSSIHMIGQKSIRENDRIINVEWMTRYMSNPNEPSTGYTYKDILYLNYIDSLNIEPLSKLCSLSRNSFSSLIKNNKLHLWLVAADYYPAGDKKYKVYYKTDQMCTKELIAAIIKLLPSAKKSLYEMIDFMNCHGNTSIYGFAIGINNSNTISLNVYLITNE